VERCFADLQGCGAPTMGMARKMAAVRANQIIVCTKGATGAHFDLSRIEGAVAAMKSDRFSILEFSESLFNNAAILA